MAFPVSKIIRVIRQPRGNMLLIGIGGSGRQSLTRLAAYMCEYTPFQIEVSKHYRKQEFRDGMCWENLWRCLFVSVFFSFPISLFLFIGFHKLKNKDNSSTKHLTLQISLLCTSMGLLIGLFAINNCHVELLPVSLSLWGNFCEEIWGNIFTTASVNV